MIHIKPIRRVKDPRTMKVVDRPIKVPKSPYWMRRLADGDVELYDVKQETPKKSEPVIVEKTDQEPVKRRSRRNSKEG